MNISKSYLNRLILCLFLSVFFELTFAQNSKIAKPSVVQYLWHEQERIMFACLDPCSWQGREYDNHTTPLSRLW